MFMGANEARPRWVAIVTGAISIAIAVVYLLLIAVLDARGRSFLPLPRPWVWWKGRCRVSLQWFHHLTHRCVEKSLERRLPTVQLEGFLHHGLKPFIPPVLVLLEVADETGAGDAGEPGRDHPLDATTDQSAGRDTLKTGLIKLNPL